MGVPRGNSGLLLPPLHRGGLPLKAADAMRGWNPAREGFYLDQASTYGMELTCRNRAI